jgi:predicted Zn-dependent protease with MMP-like domain
MVKFSMRNEPSVIHQMLGRRQFERTVERALRSLHPDIVKRLDNIEIMVEDEPSCPEDSDGCGELFGLYEGTPLTERTSGYGMTLPDKITIFRGPIERAFHDPGERLEQIRITVVHEVAHHFGIDEERLEKMGYG